MAARESRVALVPGVRRLIRASAEEHVSWIRANMRALMALTDHDPAAVHALCGVSPGTVRNFVGGTDSALGNVLLMALALGVSLGDLERPPDEFRELMARRL